MWNQREYQQCTYCVMDTTDPEIVFDENGQCNHCRAYLKRVNGLIYQGESSDRELETIAETIKAAGKNRPYDCIVGVSGGVDSSYTCYLTKKLGLRPLAVHMDNGWNSEEAVKNIKTICNSLDVDYVSYVLNWEEFKDIQLAFLKASIVEMEIPTDVAIPYALHQVAAEHNVKYIISGGNLAGEAILPRTWFYYPKDSKLLKSIHRQFGTRKIRSYPTFDYLSEIYYKFIKGIRIVYPLNYTPYSKPDAMKTLKEELGWIEYGGVHHESMFTRIVLSYLQPLKFQVDYRKCTLSAQICNGIISREDAIEKLKEPSYDADSIQEEKAYVAKKFGLTLPEFEEILALPPKSYRDYPNNEKLLDFLYGAYRRFFAGERSYHTAGYDSSHDA